MATRSIVTSQPYAACDVCGRRLLRGENPHGFLDSGEPRTVCELCIPRATQEGWLRASEARARSAGPPQSSGARTLLSRLRGRREGHPRAASRARPGAERAPRPVSWLEHQSPEPQDAAEATASEQAFSAEIHSGERAAGEIPAAATHSEEIHSAPTPWEEASPESASPDETSPAEASLEQPSAEGATPQEGEPQAPQAPGAGGPAAAPVRAQRTVVEPDAATRALELFNASEYPRRIAGIARALGEPSVVVRPAPGLPGRISIVVAWELCWYRYLVDTGAESGGTTTAAQGMEVVELDEADRLANAVAGEGGELALVR
ncbi:MAG: hypothetical protein FWD42_09215 [Solirubrobacterales bacterium]|nr:hypothetical protein [Solirubrobacterales bacterium]